MARYIGIRGSRPSIGQMRHPLIVEADKSTAVDAAGHRIPDWQPIHQGYVYANIRGLQGRELFTARQVHAEVTHRVAMRYLRTLSTQCRLRFKGRLLHILEAINLDERDDVLVLMCKEAV